MIVVADAIVLMAVSSILLVYMSWYGLPSIAIGSESLFPMSWVILVLDFALMVVFVALGVRDRSWPVVLLALMQIIPLAWFEMATHGEEMEPALLVDMLSVELILITSFVGSLICIYALKYMEHDARRPRFFAVMLVFLAAMSGAVMSNNLLWLLVFWEATTFCSYVLIRHDGTEEAKASALRALMYTLVGGVAFVFGLIFAHEELGTILLSELVAGGPLIGLALLPFGLLAIAAFTKSAQVPFQAWLLGAMVAPTPVSALLHSSTMVNLGVYLLLRLSPSLNSVTELSTAVALVGAVSFLATSVLALGDSSSKRVLAYSTIGNLGLIVLCAGIGTKEAVYAGMLLLLFHAISKALLFLAVGVVKHDTGSEDIEPMAGLRERNPFVTFALMIGVVTILLPPFGAFASKWMISEVMSEQPLLAIFLAVGFGASVVFYGKWLGRVFAIGPSQRPPSLLGKAVPLSFRWSMGALMIGAIALPFLILPITHYLVEPFLGPLQTELQFLGTTFGNVPLLALLALVAIAALCVAAFVRPRAEEVSTPYTGGEPFHFDLAGAYFIEERGGRRFGLVINLAAIVLLALLILIPLLQEVSLWPR